MIHLTNPKRRYSMYVYFFLHIYTIFYVWNHITLWFMMIYDVYPRMMCPQLPVWATRMAQAKAEAPFRRRLRKSASLFLTSKLSEKPHLMLIFVFYVFTVPSSAERFQARTKECCQPFGQTRVPTLDRSRITWTNRSLRSLGVLLKTLVSQSHMFAWPCV